MTIDGFKQSLRTGDQPVGLTDALHALWHDARGEWDEAHAIAQADSGRECSRVHAYLHRREGDESNARYWYARAQYPPVTSSLEEEWESLVHEFLATTFDDKSEMP